MTNVAQIEAEVATRGGRLDQEYTRLTKSGWRLARRNIWFGNADADERRKILAIDDDEEGLTAIVGWVDEAVRQAFVKAEALRRSAIETYAVDRFRRRTAADTDLGIMADTFEWAAWYFRCEPGRGSNTVGLMDDLTLVLAGQTPGLGAGNTSHYVFRFGRASADSTGFKREYRDRSNQVRHATASIQANMTYGEVGYAGAQLREIGATSPADLRLNSACRRVAYALRGVLYRWGPDAAPAAVGAAVRRELGDPKETGPWTGPEGGLPD